MQASRALRVLLADPPIEEEHYTYYQPTMGILYLLGSIKRSFPSSEVDVGYLQGFGSLDEHLRAIAEFRPDVYGLSFKTPLAGLGYRTLRAVKERFPKLNVVVGGSHASVLPHEVLRLTPADGCLRGECEETILQLLRNVRDGRLDFTSVPGAVYRSGQSIRENTLAPFTRDIDSFAWPAWEMIDFDRFPGMPYSKRRPYMGVLVSRGCPFRCTFCSEPVWKIFGKPTYRARAPRKIADEVEYLYGRGVRELRLWCEEFNAGAGWAVDVLTEIAALGHRDLFLNFNIRGDVMNIPLADAMAAANVWLVTMGFESASNRTLKGVQKNVTVEQIESSCAVLASRGIKVAGYFQLYSAWDENGQLCFETSEDCRRTVRWAKDLAKRRMLHYMYTSIATPRPGTPLWDLAVKHNLLRAPADEPAAYLGVGMKLPGIRPAEVRATALYANIVKADLALRNGNLNLPVLFKKARRSLRV